MEQLVELNHSLLSKLPLGVQNILKSLPLSDFSLVILAGLVVFTVVYLLFCCGGSGSENFTQEFGEYKRERKEVNVKVNTPNPKKNLRRGKKTKKETQVAEEKKEEVKVQASEIGTTDEGWEAVKAKKPKRKNE